MSKAAPAAVPQSFLTVQVGDERFALPASDIAEVIRPPAVTRVPLGPSSLLGVANLRGAVMPVVSLHRLLGGEASPLANARVVVIDRGAPVGLMIDKVTSLGAASVACSNMASRDNANTPARMVDLDALLAKDFGSFTRRDRHRPIQTVTSEPDQTAAEARHIALMCFTVAGQDFALSLASIREVVTLPEGIAVVQQTDSAMLGVTSLRGQLLPLVSLGALLGLRASGQDGERSRVVVARIGNGLVGLAVDSVKDILRLPGSAIDPVPVILTRGNAEAQIQGICRLEGGQRLVSVLSTDHLFKDQVLIEQIASQTGTSDDMKAADGPSTGDEQFIIFQLGGEEYGLPIGAVDEVVRVPDVLTRLPKAPAFIEGVMNLRGRVVPVIDQRRRFKFEGRGERRRERIVIVRIDQMQAGFVVDTASEVLSIPRNQLRRPPDLATDASQVIDRIANIEIEGRMILLLDPRELLDRAEKDLLAAVGKSLERPAS